MQFAFLRFSSLFKIKYYLFEGTSGLLAIYNLVEDVCREIAGFSWLLKFLQVNTFTQDVQNRVSLTTVISCEGRKSEENLTIVST